MTIFLNSFNNKKKLKKLNFCGKFPEGQYQQRVAQKKMFICGQFLRFYNEKKKEISRRWCNQQTLSILFYFFKFCFREFQISNFFLFCWLLVLSYLLKTFTFSRIFFCAFFCWTWWHWFEFEEDIDKFDDFFFVLWKEMIWIWHLNVILLSIFFLVRKLHKF